MIVQETLRQISPVDMRNLWGSMTRLESARVSRVSSRISAAELSLLQKMEDLGLSGKFTLSASDEPVMLIPAELEPKL